MKEQRRYVVMVVAVAVLCLGLAACATTPMSASQKAEHQNEMRDTAKTTLAQLYAKNPDAQAAVTKAAGYAVFTDYGFKLMFMGGAKGTGIAINNATKQETFMRMDELQPGLGVGAEKYRVVFIFENRRAFDTFVTSGWELGANAMAAAKTKTEGGALKGAITVSEGVYMYQLTVEGAIVGVSITGAKYFREKDLN